MKLKTLLTCLPIFLLPLACAVGAGPIKVAVIAENETVRSTIAQSGAQVLDGAALKDADVLVIQSSEMKAVPALDRAAIDAFTKRGGGVIVLGGAIAAGDAAWMKPLAGGAWTENSRKFTSLMMLFPLTDAHAITRDASAFDINDDTSYDLDLDPAVNVLASAFSPKVTTKTQPPSRTSRPGERL